MGGYRIHRRQDRLYVPDPAQLGATERADTGQRDGLTSAEQQRIKDLEREVKELRKANEILKLASAFFAQAELDRRFKS